MSGLLAVGRLPHLAACMSIRLESVGRLPHSLAAANSNMAHRPAHMAHSWLMKAWPAVVESVLSEPAAAHRQVRAVWPLGSVVPKAVCLTRLLHGVWQRRQSLEDPPAPRASQATRGMQRGAGRWQASDPAAHWRSDLVARVGSLGRELLRHRPRFVVSLMLLFIFN